MCQTRARVTHHRTNVPALSDSIHRARDRLRGLPEIPREVSELTVRPHDLRVQEILVGLRDDALAQPRLVLGRALVAVPLRCVEFSAWVRHDAPVYTHNAVFRVRRRNSALLCRMVGFASLARARLRLCVQSLVFRRREKRLKRRLAQHVIDTHIRTDAQRSRAREVDPDLGVERQRAPVVRARSGILRCRLVLDQRDPSVAESDHRVNLARESEHRVRLTRHRVTQLRLKRALYREHFHRPCPFAPSRVVRHNESAEHRPRVRVIARVRLLRGVTGCAQCVLSRAILVCAPPCLQARVRRGAERQSARRLANRRKSDGVAVVILPRAPLPDGEGGGGEEGHDYSLTFASVSTGAGYFLSILLSASFSSRASSNESLMSSISRSWRTFSASIRSFVRIITP